MEIIFEMEKTIAPSIVRKKFRSDEIHKMIKVGILPEESGWELIRGEIVRRMSIGSKHVGTVIKIGKLFERKIGEDVLVSTQNPVHLDEYNEPEPDVALLKPREDFYTESLPVPTDVLLLVEVSDSTVEYDREFKKILYAEAEIAEFWLVNLKNNTIECYTSPKNGNYRLAKFLARGETIDSETIEKLSLRVEEILGS
ncbi:Uma2 family endonuclease [soil metagenome]|jgi:Uma2 family endonuclease